MSSLKALPAIGVIVLLLAAARLESQPLQALQDPSALDSLLRRAVAAANSKKYEEALQLYQQLERSSDRWYSWAGTSGIVVVHRMAGAPDSARKVTERVAAERPGLAGLMAIWDGDTAMLEGDVSRAVASYRRAADEQGRQIVEQADRRESSPPVVPRLPSPRRSGRSDGAILSHV
jgi:tetratricopeptide (TPR) repeat protein